MASEPPGERPRPASLRAAFDLRPNEAISYLEAKGYRTTVSWTEMWEAEHASAFTVAKVAKTDLLITIHKSLVDAQARGIPFEQWARELQPELERAGWWGRVQDRELTGTSRPVFIGPRRLRTIYETNLRMSRAVALWDRIQASKVRLPYLRYSAVLDNRTRPMHRKWHGTILPVDHPWWLTHFPPNGWRCRCTVMQLSDADLARRGWTVSKTPPEDGPVRPFWRRGAEAPVFVPPGIDPGFAYNPGIARAAALAEKMVQTLEDAARLNRDLAQAAVRELVQSEGFERFLQRPDAFVSHPVMVLDDTAAKAIEARASIVRLSSETMRKQLAHHPDLTLADYADLPALGELPDLILLAGDRKVMLLRSGPDRWIRATVKRTANGGELYLVNFQRVRSKEVERLRRRLEVIFER